MDSVFRDVKYGLEQLSYNDDSTHYFIVTNCTFEDIDIYAIYLNKPSNGYRHGQVTVKDSTFHEYVGSTAVYLRFRMGDQVRARCFDEQSLNLAYD